MVMNDPFDCILLLYFLDQIYHHRYTFPEFFLSGRNINIGFLALNVFGGSVNINLNKI